MKWTWREWQEGKWKLTEDGSYTIDVPLRFRVWWKLRQWWDGGPIT